MSATADQHLGPLLDLIGGNWTTQVVGVAAELGIADVLSREPKDIASLARVTCCDETSLQRLMRALVSLGICNAGTDERFELTQAGALLASDAESSVRSWAIWTARHSWAPWGRLLDSVRTGESARKLACGYEGYSHLEADSGAASIFNRAMMELTRPVARSLAQTHSFSTARRVADLGGGYGELLISILAAHTHLDGVLFDLQHSMEGARSRIVQCGMASRCDVVVGNFFEWVPDGCDLYLLKSVLHNWNDERCTVLLRHCCRAVGGDGRVLIIERLLPERVTGLPAERLVMRGDLNMMVGSGGQERTQAQYFALLEGAGLRVERCVPIALGFSLIEGVAKRGA